MKEQVQVYLCFCKWKGEETELIQKRFGAYCGDKDDFDNWGWDEWENLACPKCGREIDHLIKQA